MDTFREQSGDLHVVFIDLEKIYDKLLREVLWRVLEKKYVAVIFINVIKDIYDRTTYIRTSRGYIE